PRRCSPCWSCPPSTDFCTAATQRSRNWRQVDVSEEKIEIHDARQRRILLIVLALNLALAAGFGVTGVAAGSSALIANGLDNASDSAVYIITLLALSRSQAWKRSAAKVSGWLLILFAAGILLDVGR